MNDDDTAGLCLSMASHLRLKTTSRLPLILVHWHHVQVCDGVAHGGRRGFHRAVRA